MTGALETNLSGVVYLDRDGTINDDPGYLSDPDDLVLFPGAAGAVKKLNDAGLTVALITNQSGIGRNLLTEEDLAKVHERLAELLKAEGARLDGIYFCPHLPNHGCECRKPAPGLVKMASEELGLAGQASYMVGDKFADMRLAEKIGARGVLVLTGFGTVTRDNAEARPAFIAADLTGAVDWILEDLKG